MSLNMLRNPLLREGVSACCSPSIPMKSGGSRTMSAGLHPLSPCTSSAARPCTAAAGEGQRVRWGASRGVARSDGDHKGAFSGGKPAGAGVEKQQPGVALGSKQQGCQAPCAPPTLQRPIHPPPTHPPWSAASPSRPSNTACRLAAPPPPTPVWQAAAVGYRGQLQLTGCRPASMPDGCHGSPQLQTAGPLYARPRPSTGPPQARYRPAPSPL